MCSSSIKTMTDNNRSKLQKTTELFSCSFHSICHIFWPHYIISVLVTALEPIELVVERRMLHKLLNIMENTPHLLQDLLVSQRTVYNGRPLQLHYTKGRYRMSVLSNAIYNDSRVTKQLKVIHKNIHISLMSKRDAMLARRNSLRQDGEPLREPPFFYLAPE